MHRCTRNGNNVKAFSVRDLKAEHFNPPYFTPSIGEGERVFAKLVQNSQSDIGQFPEDFQLFYVGDFDEKTASYRALEAPQHICDAQSFRKQ